MAAKKKSPVIGDGFDFNEFKNLRKAYDLVEQQANYRVYSTGSLFLDCAIGQRDPIEGNGGVPERTIMEVFGKNQSMKSATTEQLMKSVLESDPENKIIIVYTEEPDMDRFASIGIDLEKESDRIFILGCYEDQDAVVQTAEKYLEIVKRAIQDETVKLVIIDSVKALCSEKQLLDKKGDIKDMSDEDPIAARARLMQKFLSDFNSLNKKAILIMVNQVSDQIGISFEVGPELRPKTPGGRYMEFMAQLRIENTTRPIYTEKEHPLTGKKLVKGWEVWYKLVKNKFKNKSIGRSAVSYFFFEDSKFNRSLEILNLAEFLGIIDKGGGGMYTIRGTKIKGKPEVIKYLDENLKLRNEIEYEILDRADELFNDKYLDPEDEVVQ